MRKKRRHCSIARNLNLPAWLKFRMNDELKGLVEWMVDSAEKTNADKVGLSGDLKHRPWKITLQARRIYNKKQ